MDQWKARYAGRTGWIISFKCVVIGRITSTAWRRFVTKWSMRTLDKRVCIRSKSGLFV
jgi:hypothetical protein